MARESRKIFRFFCTIQEIKRINDKIKDLNWKKEKTSILLDLISRFGYLIYWSFDNLYVLAALRNLPRKKQGNYIYISNIGWFLGNLVSIFKTIYDIICLLRKAKTENLHSIKFSNENFNNVINNNNSELVSMSFNRDNSLISKNNYYSNDLFFEEIKNLHNEEISNHFKEIIARLCDMVISSHFIGIPQRFFNFRLNDLILSICGLTSSFII